MNLATQWATAAGREPQKAALFWGDATFTHAQLYHQSRWLAAELERLGVRPGDRVGLWLKNCPEFVPALFGIFMANAAAVPINNFLKPEEVAFILEDAGIRHLITDASLAEPSQKLVEKHPGLVVWMVEKMPAMPGDLSDIPPSGCVREEKDLAVLIYTSGTTGRPKGAMLTHGNLLHNIRSCQQMLESTLGDRFVLLLPMFHSFMLTVCVLLPLCTGASIVLIKSIHPAKNIILEILRHQGTILPAVPSFFRLFAQAELPPQLPLRLCISGGAALPVEILREFNRKFPLPLLEGYGLSETSPVASLNPIRGPWKEGSIGVPIPDVELSVQDDQGRFLPPREIGEICIRGGNVMAGYWNQPEATAAVMRDGWLLTGDVGYRDEDGYFYITDRKKDMLIVNGINVYPREIEELIYQYPGIREAAVIGVPDARRGEQPVAFVSLNEGAAFDEYALLRFLRERMAHYKVPRKVTVLPALPRNATGKILKTELRKMA
ncbi:long-chain fatty acid--CoA ligase [Fontisphaera persica]|uniref:long-chain-fatty-acid--CoA ligase n=1 Tax=Fontisphaera persica TaxID=2974023 RepID=UPI0024C0D19D|nr:long-chain fatty acid--CoA ligase [Fontisphaera persica]WCJ59850.1 long-chain fatty acid--CoA ligase [Fontisphaera persica]